MNNSKSPVSLNLSRHSSCSDIEEISIENISELNDTLDNIHDCSNLVREIETPTHRHFELLNSQKKKVMKLKFKKDLKIRIKSNCVKRQELDHIHSQCMTFNRIPDWGYDKCDQRYEEGQ